MSAHLTSHPGPTDVEHTIVRGLEVGAALYARDHAAKGTPIGAEGTVGAQTTRTAGNFLIAAFLFHVVIAPYLILTAVIFAIPPIGAAALLARHGSSAGIAVTVAMFLACLVLWVRYAVYGWLYRKFIRPVDATLTGRKLDDPARKPSTRFKDDPRRYLVEYGELSRVAREHHLRERTGIAGQTTTTTLTGRRGQASGLGNDERERQA